MLYKFNILFLLFYLKFVNNSTLSSTIQQTVKNLSTYVYKMLNLFCCICNFIQYSYILRKSLTQIHPNLTILWRMCILCKFCQLCWQYIFAYYACIILIAFTFLVCSKWCWYNRLKPSTRVKLGWESDASLYSSHKSHPILLKVSVILVWVVNISLAWYTASIIKCGQQSLKNNQSSN